MIKIKGIQFRKGDFFSWGLGYGYVTDSSRLAEAVVFEAEKRLWIIKRRDIPETATPIDIVPQEIRNYIKTGSRTQRIKKEAPLFGQRQFSLIEERV